MNITPTMKQSTLKNCNMIASYLKKILLFFTISIAFLIICTGFSYLLAYLLIDDSNQVIKSEVDRNYEFQLNTTLEYAISHLIEHYCVDKVRNQQELLTCRDKSLVRNNLKRPFVLYCKDRSISKRTIDQSTCNSSVKYKEIYRFDIELFGPIRELIALASSYINSNKDQWISDTIHPVPLRDLFWLLIADLHQMKLDEIYHDYLIDHYEERNLPGIYDLAFILTRLHTNSFITLIMIEQVDDLIGTSPCSSELKQALNGTMTHLTEYIMENRGLSSIKWLLVEAIISDQVEVTTTLLNRNPFLGCLALEYAIYYERDRIVSLLAQSSKYHLCQLSGTTVSCALKRVNERYNCTNNSDNLTMLRSKVMEFCNPFTFDSLYHSYPAQLISDHIKSGNL